MQIAESYRLSNRINLAEPYYQAAVSAGIQDETVHYYYAYALKANGKYMEAENQMETYLQNATNFEFIEKGERELENLRALEEITARTSFYEIKIMLRSIRSSLNMRRSIRMETSISVLQGDGKIYKATGQSFTDIYKVPFGESGMSRESIEAIGQCI